MFLAETGDLEVLGKVLVVAEQVGMQTRCHRLSFILCCNF